MLFVGAEKVVFSVVRWKAFGLACASQATAFDDDVSACCGIYAISLNLIAPVPFVETFISPLAPSAKVMFPAFVPLFVFKIKSPVPWVVNVASALLSPIWTVSACKVTSPVPFGVRSILPLEPSVIVIVPELVPEFVSIIRLWAPLDVIVASAAPVPTLVSPVPFGIKAISIFESSPVADMLGALPVAAFVTSNWFTAELVVWNISCSLLFSSAIKCASSIIILCELVSKFPPNCGDVSSETSEIPVPIARVLISGFVPSLAAAKRILSPLLEAPKVNVDPEPETYLNWNVWEPEVEYLKI